MRAWTDRRDRCDWKVFLGPGSGSHGAGPGADGSPGRILFRGRLAGRPVTLATGYPGGKALRDLSDYELQWYLDEALSRFLEPERS